MDFTPEMSIVTVLGIAGVVLAIGVQLPQTWRSVVAGRVAGLSFASVVIGTASAATWLGWSLVVADWWLVVSSAVYVAGGAAVAARLVTCRAPRGDWPLAATWVAVLAVAMAVSLLHVPALEVVLAAGSLVFGAPQVRAAWCSRDTSGISATSWAVYGLDGAVWLVYGALAGRTLPMWWGAATVVVVAGVLTGMARSRRRPVAPSSVPLAASNLPGPDCQLATRP
jgi:uncharacterized protein with PQ loop repeat